MTANNKETVALNKIADYQRDLADSIKEFKIRIPSDLSKINRMVRRGMVQTVGDIFELTRQLSDVTLAKLPLSIPIIKQFRHAASHQYGRIDDILAFACIEHCVDKALMKKVLELAKGMTGVKKNDA